MPRQRPRCACVGFTAATWNVFHGTHVSDLRPTLDKLIVDDVSIFLLQESAGTDIGSMLRMRQLKTHAEGEHRVAWNPQRFSLQRTELIKGREVYFRPGKSTPVTSDALLVELRDELSQIVVSALSYHAPSHVQVLHAPVRRLAALHSSVAQWRALASKRDVCLFGGDDNVDESLSASWRFMRRAATGLRLVQSPDGTTTHDQRRIDDFRVKGLRARDGYVVASASDHKAHVRRFEYVR